MIVGYFILFILLLHTLDSMGCCNKLISHAWDEIKFLSSYLLNLGKIGKRQLTDTSVYPLNHHALPKMIEFPFVIVFDQVVLCVSMAAKHQVSAVLST